MIYFVKHKGSGRVFKLDEIIGNRFYISSSLGKRKISENIFKNCFVKINKKPKKIATNPINYEELEYEFYKKYKGKV